MLLQELVLYDEMGDDDDDGDDEKESFASAEAKDDVNYWLSGEEESLDTPLGLHTSYPHAHKGGQRQSAALSGKTICCHWLSLYRKYIALPSGNNAGLRSYFLLHDFVELL